MISPVFGLQIVNIDRWEAARRLLDIVGSGKRAKVYFINAHCVNVAANDSGYRRTLEEADLLFADGSGVRLAATIFGHRLVDNLCGTDLCPIICAKAAEQGVKVALLGARPGVARRCADRLMATYPDLKVVWVSHGYIDPEDTSDLLQSLRESEPDILFVGMGVPRQEQWIARNAEASGASVVLGVGAFLDFGSGDMPRAPIAMRKIGLEWVYRLVQEPRRLAGRYLIGNPVFVLRTFCHRLGLGPFSRRARRQR